MCVASTYVLAGPVKYFKTWAVLPLILGWSKGLDTIQGWILINTIQYADTDFSCHRLCIAISIQHMGQSPHYFGLHLWIEPTVHSLISLTKQRESLESISQWEKPELSQADWSHLEGSACKIPLWVLRPCPFELSTNGTMQSQLPQIQHPVHYWLLWD